MALLVAGVFSNRASALAISDFDLSHFSFDVQSYDVGTSSIGLGGDATASGTSNGIGWSMSPTNLWSDRTTTDGSFGFSALPVTTDNLHPSVDFTLSFASGIDALLVALSNNDCCDSVNFGINPSDTSGDVAVDTITHQITLTSAAGGLALFTGLGGATSLTHTDNNGVSDGFDLAFHAVAAQPSGPSGIPAPATLTLVGAGLIALARLSRRARAGT